MEKAIFYEENGGWLHKCMFAGLDNNNKPQWLIMDHGEKVVTQEEYEKDLCIGKIDFKLLCEEDEIIDSWEIAKLMTTCLSYSLKKLDWRYELLIRTLKELGVDWKHTPLKFRFCVIENNKGDYALDILLIDEMYSDSIACKTKIASLADTLAYVKTFLIGLSEFANIKNTAELVISKNNYNKLSSTDKVFFAEITRL